MFPIISMALIEGEDNIKRFEKLYIKYRDKAYRTAYKILRSEILAEDAVSESFLKIAMNFQNIQKLNSHKIGAYIVITVRNTSLNLLKKENRIETVDYDDEIEYVPNTDNISTQRLSEIIGRLTETDQEIIYLRYTLGLKYNEIAIALSISSDAARQRMRYAMLHLKKELEE